MAATARAVDLTNAKEGGSFRPRRKPEGEYLAKIVKADDHQPKKEGSPLGWVLTIQIDGDARSTYPYYLSPEAKQAWKIGGICRAAGLNVKAARVKFDPNKLVNKAIGVMLVDDDYEGREKSVIDEVFPVSDLSPNADEDVPDDEDYDTADDEVEIPEDDEEPEEDEVEEEPEPEPVAVTRKIRRKPAPVVVEEPEDDDEEDEEEDPEPAPVVRKRRVTTPPAAAPKRRVKAAPAPVADDDEDDLDEVDLDDLDD